MGIRSQVWKILKIGFSPFSSGNILEMAPRRPYLHKIWLLTSLFVAKTFLKGQKHFILASLKH